MAHTVYAFLPPHNPREQPPTMGTSQEKSLGNERFRQNQALFRRCTTLDGAIKKHIIMAVQPVFLFPLVEQLMGFGQVTTLQMLQHLSNYYSVIDYINLEENAVKMMGPYNPVEPLARLIDQLEKGQ